MATQDHAGPPAKRGTQVHPAREEKKATRDRPGQQAMPDRQALLANLAKTAPMGPPDHPG
jgi:hypothetical protein